MSRTSAAYRHRLAVAHCSRDADSHLHAGIAPDPLRSSQEGAMTVVHLATSSGLLQLDVTGATRATEFDDREVVAVDARGDLVTAAVSGGGVWLRENGVWRNLGLEDATVWTVALGDDHEVFAGVEPAALWCLGDGNARELRGLDATSKPMD
jgi:hypothetical protein